MAEASAVAKFVPCLLEGGVLRFVRNIMLNTCECQMCWITRKHEVLQALFEDSLSGQTAKLSTTKADR